ncbi:hypothetical protein HDU76_004999 [Blyttiomyces sp. JEL0837]|nr:hypothetical protein HDU76_004999 [Blyttiomyces sp. JEL0837]
MTAHIPIIDFGKFLHGSPSDRLETAKSLVDAYKSVGFIYLSNHGIPEEQIETVFAESKGFFDLPMDEKEKLPWDSPEANRGYSSPGREKVTQLLDAAEVDKLRKESPDLKTAHNLSIEIMRSIALGLNLPETYFDPYISRKDNTLRLLHYPPVSKSLLDKENQSRAGSHTDYGTVTLLFQDDVGGLEVLNTKGEWERAVPIKGTIVVNAADLLMRWSNDVIKSTHHRVVSPPPSSTTATTVNYPARYSIAYFCDPNHDAVIECLPGIGGAPKYEPVKTRDYMVMRLSATYGEGN